MIAAVALTAVIALEHDDAVAFSEARTGEDVVHHAHTFMAQVLRIVMPLEVVFRPDSASFEADRRNFGADDGITRLERWIGPFDGRSGSRGR